MTVSSNGNHLFQKRDCLACPPQTPSCGSCPAGQVCSLIQSSCDQCAHTVCVSSGITTGTPTTGPNVPAIAGGVVGGVAFVAIVTLLTWWFWIRPRRGMDDFDEDWEEYPPEEDTKSQFREDRDARASVHTNHSVASTMLSRASNMIPIAFIPGVTNRDGTMNSAGTPPVPPIPAARGFSASTSPHSSQPSSGDAIFFSPGDLRNSAYSGVSTLDHRKTFMTRNSISPSLVRESVASDILSETAAANPVPATQAVMTRPNMVSVKSTPSIPTPAGSGESSPSSPKVMIPSSTSPSIRSNASSTFAKPTAVTISNNKAIRVPTRHTSDASTATKPSIRSPLGLDTDTEDDDEDPHARARQSLLRNTSAATSPTTDNARSPFSDGTDRTDVSRNSTRPNTVALSAVIEEATRRASRVSSHGASGTERNVSPFDDENADKDDKDEKNESS